MNENQIRENFRAVIFDKTNDTFGIFLNESAMPQKLELQENVIYKVTEEQTDLAFDDFMQEVDQVSEDEINDLVRDYVNENYDTDFLMVKIEEKIDYDQIREELTDDLMLNLRNTEPYNVVPREYWYTQSRRVQNVEELAEYTKTDGLEPFTEKYAPDWEEIAKQNQD